MIIEKADGVVATTYASDVLPGAVVRIDDEYYIRGNDVDEYNDPLFVRLKDGDVYHPDRNMMVVPVNNAKVVL